MSSLSPPNMNPLAKINFTIFLNLYPLSYSYFFTVVFIVFKCKIVALLSSGTQAGGVLLLSLPRVRRWSPPTFLPCCVARLCRQARPLQRASAQRFGLLG